MVSRGGLYICIVEIDDGLSTYKISFIMRISQ